MSNASKRSVFISKRMLFMPKHEAFKDMVQGHMAQDIEIALKTSAGMPVLHGVMKGQTRSFKNQRNQWRVEVDTAYAAYQERGRRKDGTRVVRHYHTAGTSAGFFMRAINGVIKNRNQYVKEAARAVGI